MKSPYFIVLLLVLSLVMAPPAGAANPNQYVVTDVHDGDTVSIKWKSFIGFPLRIEKVRLIGIDAPEFRQEPWGRLSKRHLKKLLAASDRIISIEFDIVKRDKYGRLLGYLWDKKGRMINESMIESGYALLYTVPPNVRYVDRLTAAQARARGKRAGFWGAGGLRETPSEWRMRRGGHW